MALPNRATEPRPANGGTPVGIGPADDELVAIDVRVVDAAGVEMFPDQADRDFLDRDRVLQRSQLLVERDQEMPLGGHTLEHDSSRFR